MRQRRDLTNSVFGRLTVIKRISPIGTKHIKWECVCTCGNTSYPTTDALLKGRTTSCGCFSKIAIAERSKTHGCYKTALYSLWVAMKDRCDNPNNKARKYYKDKGITYSDDWKQFENFKRDMGERPAGMTLERIDNSKGYSKENCKWATRREQRLNQDCNTIYRVGEVSGTLLQVIEALGLTISSTRVSARIKRGWSVEDAFLLPLTEAGKQNPGRPKKRTYQTKQVFTVNGITAPLSKLVELFSPSISYSTVAARIKLGWPIEDALFVPTFSKRCKT